jgi:hypothetical protein
LFNAAFPKKLSVVKVTVLFPHPKSCGVLFGGSSVSGHVKVPNVDDKLPVCGKKVAKYL